MLQLFELVKLLLLITELFPILDKDPLTFSHHYWRMYFFEVVVFLLFAFWLLFFDELVPGITLDDFTC